MDNEPPEIGLLAPEDQSYVRRWIAGYVSDPRVTFVNTETAVVSIGPQWFASTPSYRVAILVHEASHVHHQDKRCCVACEVRANYRAAEAMDRIGASDDAAYLRGLDGKHNQHPVCLAIYSQP